MWTDAETMMWFSNTCWWLLLLTVKTENSSESDNLLVNERDSECHKAVVSDSEVHKADEVSEVRLVGEIYNELEVVSA